MRPSGQTNLPWVSGRYLAVQLVVGPGAFVAAAVGPPVLPGAFFLARPELAFVAVAVRRDLDAAALLSVLLPVPDELAALEADEAALAVGAVVEPVALVHVAVAVREAALAADSVLAPLAVVG